MQKKRSTLTRPLPATVFPGIYFYFFLLFNVSNSVIGFFLNRTLDGLLLFLAVPKTLDPEDSGCLNQARKVPLDRYSVRMRDVE